MLLVLRLFKIFHCGFEHLRVVVAGNVLVESLTVTLGVSHLTEDKSVGRGDTLDREAGIVRVIENIRGRLAVKINVLRCDLSVLGKFENELVGGKESTLTVRDRYRVDLTDLRLGKPRRHIRCDSRANDSRLVTTDRVKGQRRAILIGVNDLTVRNETKLDDRLESVTDTCHQSTTNLDQLIDLLLDRAVTEERRDKLTRTVGLVSTRKSAGNKDDLRILDLLCKSADRIRNSLRGEVIDDDRIRSSFPEIRE